MDIKHLRYFVGIAEAGSLMKAAERLHVAQPALSVHLSNLEAELGVQLVERSSRGVQLNENGQLLYERAVAMLRYHTEAILALKQRKTSPAGSVSIGLPSNMPELIGPQLHAAVRNELPEVNLYLLDASSSAIYDWLQSGKIDFAVVFNIPDNVGFALTPLYIEHYCLVGHFQDEPQVGVVDFDRVFDYPLVMSSMTTSWRKILEEEAAKRNRSLTVQFETESFNALRAIAMSGQGYAIMPWSGIHADCMEGRLQARRIVNPDIRGLTSIACLNNKLMTAAQQAVHDILVRTVKDVSDSLQPDADGTLGAPARKVCPSALFARPVQQPRVVHKLHGGTRGTGR